MRQKNINFVAVFAAISDLKRRKFDLTRIMIHYDLGDNVEACSTNIGEERFATDAFTPAHQAHSTLVAAIPDEQDATYGVDALITDWPGIRIGVRTADCVPILLYDSVRQAVAAIHSGWKGSVDNIISHTLIRMRDRYGCDARNIKAAIGPCIHVEAFEVGDDVYDAFDRNGYADFARRMTIPSVPNSEVKWHIDLPAVCSAQLQRMGVSDIHIAPFCTFNCHDRFYSYRSSHSTDKSHRIFTTIMLK